MFKPLPLLIFFFLALQLSFAGNKDSTETKRSKPSNPITAPAIGYNIGYLNYFGDVKLNGYKPSFGSRLGHQFYISKGISNSFAISYNFLAGKIYGEELRGSNNLNFKTSLFAQSLMVEYNFYNLIKPDDDKKLTILPFLGFGLEAVIFRAKADMTDANGNTYYYWDDGTIKDLPQTQANVDLAQTITRDNTYETELRDANLDGFGKYSQITFAMPFSLGAEMRVGKNFGVRLSATYHMTFSDMLDNLSSVGSGNRHGEEGNDMFLFSSLGISYKFGAAKAKKEKAVDTDEDGIADLFDKCRDTPKGAKVDKQGCPLVNEKDRDADGVLDVVDKCRDSAPGSVVDKEGCSVEQKADADSDGIMNALDKCADTPAGAKVDSKGCPLNLERIQQALEQAAKEEKPAEAKENIDAEQRDKEATGVLTTETKTGEVTEVYVKHGLVDGKYFFADLNKNGEVEVDEVNEFIDRFFEKKGGVTIKTIDEILEYYFDQDIK